MNETDQLQVLLREIRDLHKEHLAEYKAQAALSIRLADESAERRKAKINNLKLKALVNLVSVLVAVGCLALAAWGWSHLS